MSAPHDTWQWQEPGTAWRGIGIYHVTLTVTSRQPVLGSLVIPDNDPKQARVDGQIFIFRDDKTYTLTGQEVK